MKPLTPTEIAESYRVNAHAAALEDAEEARREDLRERREVRT